MAVLTETGEVVELDGNYALVRVTPQSGCSGCQQSGSCGTSALSKLFVNTEKRPLRVHNHLNAGLGDSVDLSMDESGLIKHSFMAYGLPLFGLLFFSVLAQKLLFSIVAPQVPSEWMADWSAIIGGGIGLFLGWGITKFFYQPVLPKITKVYPLEEMKKHKDD